MTGFAKHICKKVVTRIKSPCPAFTQKGKVNISAFGETEKGI